MVDDGSPDRCPEICDGYAEKDKRVRVIHKENGGLSDARNAGLKAASGAYIGFVDSDDRIAPDMYEELMRHMTETGADISACMYITEEDGVLREIGTDGETVVYDREEALDQIYRDGLLKSHVWDKLYRKEIFDDIAFPKGRCYEDIYIMHEVFAKANKVVFCKKGLYYYRLRDDSIVRSKDIEKLMDRLYCQDHRYSSVHAKGREDTAAHAFYYSGKLAKLTLYALELPSEEKRKYNKQINRYILKYCKGPSLTVKERILKWVLVIMPSYFCRKAGREKSKA